MAVEFCGAGLQLVKDDVGKHQRPGKRLLTSRQGVRCQAFFEEIGELENEFLSLLAELKQCQPSPWRDEAERKAVRTKQKLVTLRERAERLR